MSFLDNVVGRAVVNSIPGGSTYLSLKDYADGSKPTRSTDESPDAHIARNRLAELKNEFDGAYQKPQVVSYDEPSQMSDLYERVSAMSMTDVNTLHTRWETLRNKLEQGFKTYDAEIGKAIGEKWTGNAGASAGAGIKDYVEKSGNLLASAQMMAEKVKVVESAMQIAKDRVQPHEGSTLSGIASYIPGPTWKMDSHNADTAKSEGAEVVKGIYYEAIKIADTDVPLVPQPYNPLDTGSKPGDDDGSKGDTEGTKPTTQQPTTQQPTTEQPTTEQPTTETPTTEDPSDDDTGDDTTPSSTEPAATTPQSTVPTTPTGTTPGSTTPMGTGGSPGGGSPGAGTPGSGVPGAAVPGTPGGAAAGKGGAGAGGAGSAASGRGMSGMGGMGAGGGKGGKGDDEKESGTKDYLINQENGEELTGLSEDQRAKTVPPVIGA
ncbi:hypothetical protein ACFTS5_02035 [Nocardia sp. NPDC056952]|uniref:hypothetical protein n=1 Tax=Nocardia sp. NPDC056952 TaxID=3345979 RepID=UPI00362AA934